LLFTANSAHDKPKDSPKLLAYIIASQVFKNFFLILSSAVPLKNIILGCLQNFFIFKNKNVKSFLLFTAFKIES